VVLALAGPAAPQASPGPLTAPLIPPSLTEDARCETLDNGLRVLCLRNRGTQTVAVSAVVCSSCRAEAPALAGIRYFVCQALVAREEAAAGGPGARLDDLGAEVYSGATLDFSHVTVHATTEDLEPAVLILRDLLVDARFEESAVARLRQLTAAQLQSADEQPDVVADQAAAARLFPNHAYGRPVEGSAATVPSFSLDQVRRVYEGSYLPNNMLLVVAGGAAPERALAAVRRAFGGVLPGTPLAEASGEALAQRGGVEELHRAAGTALVHIGARAPGLGQPQYPAAAVAMALLGAGMGSRLYDALRREEGSAYSFAATLAPAREVSRASVVAACPADRVLEVEGRMLLALRTLAIEPASVEEIHRAKEYTCTSNAIAHQRSVEVAHQLAALEVAAGQGLELDRDLPRLVRAVTAEDVRSVAQAMFETRVRVRVQPP
jgi:predicted Zn-dependent peptidase